MVGRWFMSFWGVERPIFRGYVRFREGISWIYCIPLGEFFQKGDYWEVRFWDLLEKVTKRFSQMVVFHGDEYHGRIRTKSSQKNVKKNPTFPVVHDFCCLVSPKFPVVECIPPKWGWTTKSAWSNHLLSMSFCAPSTYYTILAHDSAENYRVPWKSMVGRCNFLLTESLFWGHLSFRGCTFVLSCAIVVFSSSSWEWHFNRSHSILEKDQKLLALS